MFLPKFKLVLKKENFYPDEVVCLGSQLITIINILQKILEPHTWYVSDMDALSEGPEELNLNSFLVKKIGNDYSLIKICSEIDQFLSGVFLAIKAVYSCQKMESLEVGTEDEAFRSLAMDGVLIEIRAFDTSFFELYSDREEIMKELAHYFNVNIISRP